ncbi:hypothetical protein FWF93_01260 [Candidatus Saccharibacteria bacterium]|nr:hypothetical protein [Candidatus Saccharibacteria bacterium]
MGKKKQLITMTKKISEYFSNNPGEVNQWFAEYAFRNIAVLSDRMLAEHTPDNSDMPEAPQPEHMQRVKELCNQADALLDDMLPERKPYSDENRLHELHDVVLENRGKISEEYCWWFSQILEEGNELLIDVVQDNKVAECLVGYFIGNAKPVTTRIINIEFYEEEEGARRDWHEKDEELWDYH